jgi:hypothetical protein
MGDENLIVRVNHEVEQVPLESTLRPSLSQFLSPKCVSERSLTKLSTAYPQIRPRVVHNCPVDSQICNTFPARNCDFI